MEQLIKELRLTVGGNGDVSIIHEARWHLPISSYEVSFGRVKRFKMDVLMKMLLFAFQETDIHRAATLADMLLVEELFIRDLIDKMQRTGLIHLEKKGYKLTAKGIDYLEKGIFEEDMEAEQTLILYSTVHDMYFLSEDNRIPEGGGKLPPYRYVAEENIDRAQVVELLSNEGFNSEEEGFQILVTEVTDHEELEAEFIPCIEFQLYDQKQDLFFARVWNTMTSHWDEVLEKQIEEHEVVKWREEMEEKKLET
ncbi:hypothetical protein [Planococcus lenghuensis]|uniref:Uncharacterized protein n=1 Tax=Planococcus lenghuensis TaxID=2213202 RepID=A0A1Q2KVZ1_9BACL|nr:hypothetical protein [Planococcus lenghuensis]AQQ52286.1 hypothetical protein B0X71_03605 [Planococcus lenghuensis]